jgi:hypothetical protein
MSNFSGTEYTFLKNIEGFDQTLQTSLNEDDGYVPDALTKVQSAVVKNALLQSAGLEVLQKNIENPGQATVNTVNAAVAYDLPAGKARDAVIEGLYGADAGKVKEIVDVYKAYVTQGGTQDDTELAHLISTYQTVQTGAKRTEAARTAVQDTAPDAILNDPDAKKTAEDKIRKELKKNNVPAGETEDAAEKEAKKILDGVLKFGPQRYLLKNISTLAFQAQRRKLPPLALGIPYTKVVALQDSSTNAVGRLTKRENAPKIMGLTTDQLSALVPKIKLFKINYDDDMNEKGRIPLKFPKGSGQKDGSQWQPDVNDIFEYNRTPTSTNNPSKFYKTRAGYGIQSFSWSYFGSDPWSANRDITASLVLYFQDFAQLSVERMSSSGGNYRYLDLLLSVSDEKFHAKTGIKKPLKKMYQQDIIAEVGWATPNSFTDEEKDIVTNNSVSLVLTMEDYSITFDEGATGTFTLQIDYRARAERITRDKLINVIAPEAPTVKALYELQLDLDRIKNKEGVDDDSYTEKKEEFDELLKDSKAESYTRLNESLAKTQSIYYTDISLEDIIKAETGPVAASNFNASPVGAAKTKDYLQQCIEDGSTAPLLGGAVKEDDKTHRFYYTFLGDVIQAAMDIGTNPEVTALFGAPAVVQKYKVILCDFVVGEETYNLADLPIEYGLLASFYFDQIQSQDTQTKTIGAFIKELLAYVIHNKIESYFNEKKGDSRSFRTSFLTMDTDIPTSGPTFLSALTLKQGPSIPYLVVHSLSSASDLHILPGKYAEAKKRDEANNLAHLTLGNRSSIIKNISFDKLDWEYAREHRLVDNSGSPFNILANVFNVTVKLFGNTLFYPGSMIFINPISMGDIGRPWVKESISNIMGLGGYHYVTKVDNSISDGVFETSITAIWQTSGLPGEGFIKEAGS